MVGSHLFLCLFVTIIMLRNYVTWV